MIQSLPRVRTYFGLLAALLVLCMLASARLGAVVLTWAEIGGFAAEALGLGTPSTDGLATLHRDVFFQIRLPRVVLCALVGAALSASGTLMQALFRNPIVEPGLIGTSAGAALGAAAVFVLGSKVQGLSSTVVASVVLPGAAFLGALAATWLVYRLSAAQGRVTVATMLLAGIAVNALATGGTGCFSYFARDPQARSITFWSLGSFSSADWSGVYLVGAALALGVGLSLQLTKGLNALQLGENEAQYLGVNVRRLQTRVLLLNTLLVAVATSLVGVIGFVGLLVPHLLRLLGFSDNRRLLLGACLLGGALLVVADAVARTVIAPAELPIGVLTAFVGAPVFLWMLARHHRPGQRGGFYA
ncbi:iron ABC transporter permease [Hymenobacter busanensis]|uniref:Iron ABC transporter permease n=1 Tax=Hymenobacter busanensis TaxID=2607656 RepID=A0A7L5A296_9BACT|nr:iron ABC transporter permease [Hymenobacter busanensis]KAA9332491.1 iron ABC transporter permease [Hymenobacter busanensis]QHJ09658.1 iron chelate uptake ABC transporter family permease subunit [Hymenobacter busanensis]